MIFDGDTLRRSIFAQGLMGGSVGAGWGGAVVRTSVQVGPHCRLSLKFLFAHFMLMLSIYEFR